MAKYTLQTKLSAVEDYCSGGAGFKEVAHRHCVDVSSLRQWVASYRAHGADGVKKKSRNFYTVEFKLTVLQRMREDDLSYRQAAALFDVRRFDMVGHWKRQYDQGGVEALSRGASGKTRIMKVQQPILESESRSHDDNKRTREQLLEELNQLRMENAYLKKLEALAQANKQAMQRRKR